MTPDLHHIHIIGRYRQGQHTLMTSRSQGQSQGHEGHFRFFCRFCMYSRIVLMGLLCILDRGIQICCDLLSTLLDVADPISLDVLVYDSSLHIYAHAYTTNNQNNSANF